MRQMRIKLGFLVNPIAGIGGRVGLKGSDGMDVLERALSMGAVPEATSRAAYALAQLEVVRDELEMVVYAGEMGETLLKEKGFNVIVIGSPAEERTTAEDTITAAKKMRDAGVEMILFAGGDGTARNVYEAIGETVPVIGIPAGVKIHSSVFATNARHAGMAVLEMIQGRIKDTALAEVMDIDEEQFRQGRLSAMLYGYMRIPVSQEHMQQTKSPAVSQQEELLDVVGHVITRMEPGVMYVIGPGTTTNAIMKEMGLEGTLLGVDVVQDGKLITSDVSESILWELVKDTAQKVKIIVTIIGGQGNLFGRGNQQISPRVIRRVEKKNLIVVATASKLNALYGAPLLVDTGDPDLDQQLSGYIQVVKGFAFTASYPVSC